MSPTLEAQAQNNDNHPAVIRARELMDDIGQRRNRAHAHRAHMHHARHHHTAEDQSPKFNLAEVTPAEGTSLPAGLLLQAKGAVNPDALQLMASAQEPKPVQRFDVEHTNKAAGPTSSPTVAGDTVPVLS